MPVTKIAFNGTVDVSQPIVITDDKGEHIFKEISGPTPPDPPIPPDGDKTWVGDAETGDLSQWQDITQAAPGRISIVTAPVDQGKYAYRFELRPGDDAYGSRVQLGTGISGGVKAHYINNGDEGYYGVSIRLPSNLATVEDWRQYAQWKGIHTGSPPLQISHNNNKWRLYYRPNTLSDKNILKWEAPDRKDVWERFTFHIKWSVDPKVGFIEMKYNGALVVPLFYTSNIHMKDGKPVSNIVNIGIYRSSSIKSTDVVHIDNYVEGTSWEAVA